MVNAFERLLSKVINITIDYGNGAFEHLWPSDLFEEKTVERKYDRRLFLKLKLKNLFDETRMIQDYEEKLKRSLERLAVDSASYVHNRALLNQMIEHRRTDIRDEVRATLLAYGYIRGLPYSSIEERRNPEPSYKLMNRVQRVYRMASKYGVVNGVDLTTTEDVICSWMGIDKGQYYYWKTRDPKFLQKQVA